MTASLERGWSRDDLTNDDFRDQEAGGSNPHNNTKAIRLLLLFFYTRARVSAMLHLFIAVGSTNMKTLYLILLLMLQTSRARPQEVGVITGVIRTADGQAVAGMRVFARTIQ